jgi:hypothetical protein
MPDSGNRSRYAVLVLGAAAPKLAFGVVSV